MSFAKNPNKVLLPLEMLEHQFVFSNFCFQQKLKVSAKELFLYVVPPDIKLFLSVSLVAIIEKVD